MKEQDLPSLKLTNLVLSGLCNPAGVLAANFRDGRMCLGYDNLF